MYLLYSALLALGLILSLPYWLLQSLRTGKYRRGLGERLGRVPQRLSQESTRPAIWVHAVSVGEVLAISDLVQELRRRHPEYRIVVSTTTDTGQKLAQTRLGRENVFYFPLDFAFAIRPYLRTLKPKLIVIAETEFWINFLRLAQESDARLAVVNARISDRSWRGYRRWRGILKRVLEPVDIFLAQSGEDQRRLVEIGAPADRVRVSGNLKFDAAAPDTSPVLLDVRQAFERTTTGPVLVCGSTVEGEEALLADAFRAVRQLHPQAVMLVAPRHPERFAEAARVFEESGLPLVRRSAWRGEPLAGAVFLVDSIGELASLYALADIAFVGGSLVPRGGHNILEPALWGAAIVVGPHTENFRDVVLFFQNRNAVRIAAAAELSSVFIALLADEAERKRLGFRAAETVRMQKGATQTTVQALEGLLDQSAGQDPQP